MINQVAASGIGGETSDDSLHPADIHSMNIF
jgi:hypothetical protein